MKKGNSFRNIKLWGNIWLQKIINKVFIFDLFLFLRGWYSLKYILCYQLRYLRQFILWYLLTVPTQVYYSKHTPVPTIVPAPELIPLPTSSFTLNLFQYLLLLLTTELNPIPASSFTLNLFQYLLWLLTTELIPIPAPSPTLNLLQYLLWLLTTELIPIPAP